MWSRKLNFFYQFEVGQWQKQQRRLESPVYYMSFKGVLQPNWLKKNPLCSCQVLSQMKQRRTFCLSHNLIINVKVCSHVLMLMMSGLLHKKQRSKYTKIHFPMMDFVGMKLFSHDRLETWFVQIIHDVGSSSMHYQSSYVSFCLSFFIVLSYFVVFL